MNKRPTILATRDASNSYFRHAEEVDLEFSNGERRTFHRLKSGGHGAVLIVPMRDADTVLLVREYSVGVERYELGAPKGRMDAGETAEEGANRELKEEVGFGARKLTFLGTLSLSPAYMTHEIHIVLAEDLYPERLEGDEPEELEVLPWRMDNLHELIARDDVTDGRSIAALFMAREFLAGRYKPA
jgi:ADP-ribose diphosphatase